MAKACASHGSRNTEPSRSNGMPGTDCVTCRTGSLPIVLFAMDESRRLKIRLEGVDGDFQGRVGIRTPQFGPVEHHRVEPLRIVALIECDGIGKGVTSVHKFD